VSSSLREGALYSQAELERRQARALYQTDRFPRACDSGFRADRRRSTGAGTRLAVTEGYMHETTRASARPTWVWFPYDDGLHKYSLSAARPRGPARKTFSKIGVGDAADGLGLALSDAKRK